MKKHTQNQSFIEGKGFYIALCSCIAVLGIIAYTGHNAGKNKARRQASDNVIVEESSPIPEESEAPVYTIKPSPANYAVSIPTPKASPKPAQTAKPVVQTVVKQASTIPPEPPKTPSFIPPAEGKIIDTFSENLSSNKTMDDWRTHDGIDIQSEPGTAVKASLDGVIEEIGSDTLGVFILINHDNGWQTLYANLGEEDISLKKGDRVKTGDKIGSVGDTSIEEKLVNPHLHFEILKDGENKNPTEFIK
ncbi:MAG: peptidoglycan DD-metalloendopeptidase family protein [Oscillospiraceae bacterium]|nr:peptidoglycan DD-metalloendopeptidase family protein [Oscillospiraceae bacterium]